MTSSSNAQTNFLQNLSFDKKSQLAGKLLACTCLASAESRQHLVRQLPSQIQHQINFGATSNGLQEIMAILEACANFYEGGKALLEAVRFFEAQGATIAFGELMAFLQELAQPAEPAPSPPNPLSLLADADPNELFPLCVELPNLAEFFGRARERMQLINRVKKGGAVSIVGERRIGKTWLLSYLRLAAAEKLGPNYRVAYLSADLPSCQTVPGFVAQALKKFEYPLTGGGLEALQEAVIAIKAGGQMPVLCLDEFEGFGNHTEFDLNFFSGMRSLADSLGLCIVTVSKNPLIKIVGEIGKTSGFFNIFLQLPLEAFSPQETDEFLLTKSSQAGFSPLEIERLRSYGQNRPLRLQLVGKQLLEDKILAEQTSQPQYHRPTDPAYWSDFEKRLEKAYAAMVKPHEK